MWHERVVQPDKLIWWKFFGQSWIMNHFALLLLCLSLASFMAWYSFSVWESAEIWRPRWQTWQIFLKSTSCFLMTGLCQVSRFLSSLHWLDPGFLYALFVQWSILATKLNPPQSVFHIWALKLFFYILKHNVPSYITLTFTNSFLLFHLQLQNLTVFT